MPMPHAQAFSSRRSFDDIHTANLTHGQRKATIAGVRHCEVVQRGQTYETVTGMCPVLLSSNLMTKLILAAIFLALASPLYVDDGGQFSSWSEEASPYSADPSHRVLRRRRKSDIASLLQHAENTDPHYVKTSEWWEVTHPYLSTFGGFNNQTMRLYLRRYDFDNSFQHSCYHYRFEERIANQTQTLQNTFCYPAIMITGVPKCSTSAMYQMLRSFDHSRSLLAKEVCPMMFSYANLHNMFDALAYVANDGTLGHHEFIVSACIELAQNLVLRQILRNPRTFYVVVVRDFADWLWSSYNYWCVEHVDAGCDPLTHWVSGGVHHRSPEHFHRLVMAERPALDATVASPMSILYTADVCRFAKKSFYNYVHELWRDVGVENTMIIASEQLEREPATVVQKLVQAIGFSHSHFSLEDFQSVRYNTNKKVSAAPPAYPSCPLLTRVLPTDGREQRRVRQRVPQGRLQRVWLQTRVAGDAAVPVPVLARGLRVAVAGHRLCVQLHLSDAGQ